MPGHEAQEQHTDSAEGGEETPIARIADRFRIGSALQARDLDLGSLSGSELDGLGDALWARLAPLFDEVVDDWQEDRGLLNEQESIERELWRRIAGKKAELIDCRSDYECDGCSFRHYDGCAFSEFHGLFLCDGCLEDARVELREIQRPLIEALAAEPTLVHARALGFELTRRSDDRLVWVGDHDYAGGSASYTDERDALDDLVDELSDL